MGHPKIYKSINKSIMKTPKFKYRISCTNRSQHLTDDIEKYVYMSTGSFEKLFGKPKYQVSPDDVEGYLKISANGKSVCRKYKSFSSLTDQQAEVDYTTLCKLKSATEVEIMKCGFWTYQWDNMNKYVRLIFVITILSFITSIVGLLIQIL